MGHLRIYIIFEFLKIIMTYGLVNMYTFVIYKIDWIEITLY